MSAPLLCAVVALLLTACGAGADSGAGAGIAADAKPNQEASKVDPVPVEVGLATLRQIAASHSGTANLEVPADAEVVARTGGVLLRVLVEEGDQVRAGQALAMLDPARLRLEVARAEATMRRLRNNFQRSSELFERNLVSAESNDQVRFEYESARAVYDLAVLELGYTTITAPISGVIAQRMVKPGNLIQPNQALYRIVDASYLEAVLNVPEREMSKMQKGLPIRMQVDALPGQVFMGAVERISPVVDARSGTFRVVGVFPGQVGLKAGMFGRLQIVYDERDDVLTVPRTALTEDRGETALFEVVDGKAVHRVIHLGQVGGEFAEVLGGLKAGAQVITAGRVAVRDGSPVLVLDAPAPDAGAAVAKAVDAPTP